LRLTVLLTAALVTLAPLTALAEEDVAAASAAFSEAQRAQLRGDYSRAAEFFELADQSAPSPAALRSAIRNRETAGQDARAATLALRALERYPDDRETKEVADGALSRLAPKLVRVKVTCNEPCRITVDGGLAVSDPVQSHELFVTPGAHAIEGRWSGRPVASRPLEGTAGGSFELALEAPPAPPPGAEGAPTSPAPAQTSAPPAPAAQGSVHLVPIDVPPPTSRSGLSPAVFWAGTGLTVVSGALLTWSGLDTLDKRNEYEENPTQDRYDDGTKLELRTNVLAATTAVLGVSTILIGAFATDWSGEGPSAQVSKDSVALSYGGRFP
jgi:hypothetical protein